MMEGVTAAGVELRTSEALAHLARHAVAGPLPWLRALQQFLLCSLCAIGLQKAVHWMSSACCESAVKMQKISLVSIVPVTACSVQVTSHACAISARAPSVLCQCFLGPKSGQQRVRTWPFICSRRRWRSICDFS